MRKSSGSASSADYEAVCSCTTDHAEAIRIRFDPRTISYGQLLKVFFAVAHDPTQVNRQGNDRGASYRSAIFYTSEEQRQVALDTIADVNASGLWPGKVVTKISEAGPFWEAEAEDQNYLQHYPEGKNQFNP